MLETPHSLVGGAIGGLTGDPYLAAATGTASHFAGDLLPHWNPNFPFRSKLLYSFVIADFVVAEALVVAFWFAFPDRPEVAVGAFFGTLPDVILGIRFLFKVRWLRSYEQFHGWLHIEVPWQYGIWPQLALSIGAVLYLAGLDG